MGPPGGAGTYIETIALLRLLDPTIFPLNFLVVVLSYSSLNDGGWGYFRWDPASTAADDDGTIIQPSAGGNGRWIRQYKGAVDPHWFGVKGNGVTDDTVKLQYVLDNFLAINVPYAVYKVSQISIRKLGGGQAIYFNGAIISGNAGVATTSVVELKSGSNEIYGLVVEAGQNVAYETAFHWYTNNLNLYSPGFNRIYGLKTVSAILGVTIGALPSQPGPIPAQGTVQAAGVATNAPLSESFIVGLQTSNCVRGVYMRQPNGKVSFLSPVITGEYLQWGGAYAAQCVALSLVDQGSELSIEGGEVIQAQTTAGGYMQITAGTLHCIGTVLETQAPSFIAGEARVNLIGCQDFGFNNVSYSPFNIASDATGRLLIADSQVVMPSAFYSTGTYPFVKSVLDITYTFDPNPSFIVEFRNCELRDFALRGSTVFVPLVQGVRAKFTECQLSSWVGGVRTVSIRLRSSTDLFAGLYDQNGSVISAYPQTGVATEGGLTFGETGAGAWGTTAAGLPTVEGELINTALRLTSGAVASGDTAQAVSAKKAITPGIPVLISGFINTTAAGGGVLLRIQFFKYDDTAASTAEQNVINILDTAIGTGWQTLCFVASPPADATKIALFLFSQNGADVQFANLSAWQ